MADQSEGKVKSQVTQAKIETDGETFLKVAPDQTCSEPLIPKKKPSKEVDFDITLEKGVIYNPRERTGIYGKTVSIGYGCRINGSIYGSNEVIINTGLTEYGTGIIYGDVKSIGDIKITEPTKTMEDYQGTAPIQIIGDIIGEDIIIDSPVVVKGNVMAKGNIDINEKTIVTGNIYSKDGKLSLDEVTANVVITGYTGENLEHSEEEEDIEVENAIDIGNNVSILHPIIWAKNELEEFETISLDDPVRVVGPICMNCEVSKSKLDCEEYKNGDCEKFESLTEKDVLSFWDGKLGTNIWRKYQESEESFSFILDKIREESVKKRKNESKYTELFEQDEYGEYMKVEDLTPEIEQTIQQTVLEEGAAEAFSKAEVEKTRIKEERLKEQMRKEERRKDVELGLKTQEKEHNNISEDEEDG